MELTIKQAKGLDIAIKRFKSGERYTVISGYAGTGKSTLVKFIVAALCGFNIDAEEDICYACYTGKAAQVLQRKGLKNTLTLHKLLYTIKPDGFGGFVYTPKESLPYRIVVVDEVSMAPIKLLNLLFSHESVHIICLGDPGQLPPISEDADNHLLDKPHIFLDEIMRQAAESDLIRLSMDIREGKYISHQYGKSKEIKIVPRKELNEGMLLWADQILCATNKTRTLLNSTVRKLNNKESSEPQKGDKIICLRNYWDCLSNNGTPLINGTIGTLGSNHTTFMPMPYGCQQSRFWCIVGDFQTEDEDIFKQILMDKNMITKGKLGASAADITRMRNNKKTRYLIPMEFTYGYAITVHKAQGSEWNKVLVQEENFPFDKEMHQRWLYTAVTRSSSQLVLVR